MLTYSIGYWEVYRRFQGGFFLVVGEGGGLGIMWEDLSMKELSSGKGHCYEGGARFPSIL
jgi:hypothetical protein